MKKEVKKQVLAKLRSGNVRKTTNTLCKPTTNRHYEYCVMGVVARTLGIKPKAMLGCTGLADIATDRDLYQECGLSTGDESTLITLNDDDNYSLKKLAKYIARKY